MQLALAARGELRTRGKERMSLARPRLEITFVNIVNSHTLFVPVGLNVIFAGLIFIGERLEK